MIDESELLAGRYRLVSQVGTGAMGVVWKAYDEHLNRVVAVKQLLQTGLSEVEAEEANRRAMREARITARLHHPHAIVVYDVIEQDGKPYLIMEYLRSESLATVLDERGPLPPAEVARIGGQIAAALAAAHEAGIVHRDIKPGNVLLADDGTAKITDFGISRAAGDCTVTATGMLIGTPAYLPPEVARGEEAGFPADVYSLGSTLYAAVEGTPPFGMDDNPLALLYRIVNKEITPPARSGPLTAVLSWLLDRDASRRPTMQQAREALAGAPGTAELPATGASAAVPPPARTGAPTAELALAGDTLAVRPAEGLTHPRRSAAVIAVAAASLVAGLMLVATLINDGTSTAGSAAGPPSTTPGTAQHEQAPQRSPDADAAAGVAPILATIPASAPVPSPQPSRPPGFVPSAMPTSVPSTVPTSGSSAQPTPEPSEVPRRELGPVPSPEPSEESRPVPERGPESSEESRPVPERGPEPSEELRPVPERGPEPSEELRPVPERGPQPGPPSDVGRP